MNHGENIVGEKDERKKNSINLYNFIGEGVAKGQENAGREHYIE